MSFLHQTKKTYTSTVVFHIGGSDRSRDEPSINPVEMKVDLKKGLVEEPLETKHVAFPEPKVKLESKPVEKDVAPDFIIKPRRQLVDEGESTKFKASFEGSSNTKVTWSKNETEIVADDHYKIFVKDDFHYLEIGNVLPEHGGSYTCALSNPAGSISTSVGLEVFEKPKPVKVAQPTLLQPLEDQLVVSGDRDIKFSCSFTNSDAATVTWFKDGKELRQGRQHRIKFDGRVANLGLTTATQADSGLYECVITNNGYEVRTCGTLTVESEKREPPYFVQELEDMEVDDGDKVELVVEVKGSEPIDVFWIHNNKEIARDDADYQQTAVSKNVFKLTISNSVPGDAGSFVCEAYNEFGDTDTFCNVIIREIEKSQPPNFILKPKLTKVLEGSSAMFTCTVVGIPLPNVYWERNGKILQNTDKYQISQNHDKHSLVIPKATKEDAGKYICRLDNQMVSMVHSTSLIVQENTTATTDFRSVLKKRSSLEMIGNQSSTDSEKSDKENNERRVPVFHNILSRMDDNSFKSRNQVNDSHSALRNKFEQKSLPIFHKPVIAKNNEKVKSVNSSTVNANRPVAELKPFNHFNAVTSSHMTDSSSVHLSVPTAVKVNNVEKYTGHPLLSKVDTFKNGTKLNKTEDLHFKSTSAHVDFRKEARIKPMEINKPLETQLPKPKQMDFRNILKPKDSEKPKDSVDFRSVLKSKDPIKNSQEPNIKPNFVQHDFRHVLSNKSDTKAEPKIVRSLSNQNVKYGSQAVLLCEIVGTPEPDIKWSINKKDIKPSRYFELKYKDRIASLTISEAFSEDEGEYTVIASNCNGSTQTSCHLSIKESSSMSSRSDSRSFEGPVAFPPKILNVNPTNISATKNKLTEIKAAFNGEPVPTIRWYKFKHELESEGRIHIKTLSNSSVLTINDLQQADSGKYSIMAENDLGCDTAKISLSVEDVPYSPMGRPFVSDITNSSVSLSWYGPAYDGGSPITGYSIEACKGSSRKWTPVTNNCRNTFYQANNLDPGNQYLFRVRALNKHGVSEPGEPSELVVTFDEHSAAVEYESDGYSDVFSPGPVSAEDELPFEPRNVTIDRSRKFEDHYETLEEIGRGKFGNVFKCKDKATKEIWAAKILKCREKEKANIRSEIEVMNKLKHPKVLMLWDAFEAQRNMVLVMEYIRGGELFERVISDDFELTERDVVHFMRQICDGVGYIHGQNIIHMDLKPENILCISNKTNQIKIIDFGLAQNFKPGESVKVLFGTPEFIAPEVVNYDEISFATDLWSIGVICYVLLSGLSPFLGDSENETLSNVTLGEYDFDDDAFTDISVNAKDFIQKLLIKRKEKRRTIKQCQNHPWLAQDEKRIRCKRLNTEKLKHFMARRKWQTSVSSPLSNDEASFNFDHHETAPNTCTKVSAESPSSALGTFTKRASPRLNLASRLMNLSKAIDSSVQNSEVSPIKKQTYLNNNNNIERNMKILDCAIKPSNDILGGSPGFQVTQSVGNPSSSLCNSIVSPSRNSLQLENSLPKLDKPDELDSHLKPCFVKEMVDCEAFSGDVIRFDVVVTKDTNITWYFEDYEIKEETRHTIDFGANGRCSLIIRQVTVEDDGEYTCKASNKYGECFCSAELIVCGAGAI